jgi:hypothetical protein
MRSLNSLVQGFIIISVLGILPLSGIAKEGTVVTLLYDHKILDPGVVSTARFAKYNFSRGMTSVEREGRTDFIDYTNLVFYRYFQTSEECRSYRLLPSEIAVSDLSIEEQALYAKAQKIGSVEVVNVETKENRIRRYPVQDKKVIWGGHAAAQRTATEPSIVMYGQFFTPTVEDYAVTTVIDRIDDLFRLAASHEAIYKSNPLLRRLDPLGLLGGLQGIPVRTRGKDFVEELSDIKYDGAGEILLPENCRLTQ